MLSYVVLKIEPLEDPDDTFYIFLIGEALLNEPARVSKIDFFFKNVSLPD